MRKLLPLYDDSAAIACSLAADDRPERAALIAHLRDAMTSLERTQHGLLLHFPADPAVEAEVRAFAVDEKACCSFWGFGVATEGDELLLQWDAPPAAADIVDTLEAWLRSDDPDAALAGFL